MLLLCCVCEENCIPPTHLCKVHGDDELIPLSQVNDQDSLQGAVAFWEDGHQTRCPDCNSLVKVELGTDDAAYTVALEEMEDWDGDDEPEFVE